MSQALNRRSFLTGLLATTAVPAVAQDFEIAFTRVEPFTIEPDRLTMEMIRRAVKIAREHEAEMQRLFGPVRYVALHPDQTATLVREKRRLSAARLRALAPSPS